MNRDRSLFSTSTKATAVSAPDAVNGLNGLRSRDTRALSPPPTDRKPQCRRSTSGPGELTAAVQAWGEPGQDVRVGDVVTIPPGQKHWHGAAPQTAVTHLAITEPRGGAAVRWMEQVSDEQYNGSTTRPPAAKRTPSAPESPRQQPAQATSPPQPAPRPSGPVQQRIAPGLAALTDDVLFGDVWRRPELSPRDRILVTVSVLIATGKPAQLAGHLGRALDNGVQATEASGLLAHLAVYCGWPSAVSALEICEQVYTARKVDPRRYARSRLGSPLRHPMRPALRGLTRSSAPSRQGSCSSPTRWYSTTCGGAPI